MNRIYALLLLLISSTTYAEYQLSVDALDTDGTEHFIGGTVSDDFDSCVYNMGLIAGSWYTQKMVATIITPYTVTGVSAILSFWSSVTPESPQALYVRMTCEPLDIRT